MPEHDHDPTLPAHCPRRAVLRGALVLGAAGVLAGCGGSSSHGAASGNIVVPPAGTDTGSSTPAPTATDSTPSPSASASETASSSGGGSVLGPASDVPVGGGKIYDGPKIVVTQPTAGEYKAFTAICTHAGCTVAEVADGTINCPCHGSKYSVSNGSVVHGPATEPLASKSVSVEGGNVSVT